MDHSGQGTRTENSPLWGLQEPERGSGVGLPWMGGGGKGHRSFQVMAPPLA